jgi:hypothetical protein
MADIGLGAEVVRGTRHTKRKRVYNALMLLLAILAIVLTVVLAPRAVRREFTVSTEQAVSLLAEDPIFEEITVLYRGNPIPNLSKFVFHATNTGREPILEEEVKQPPTVSFTGDGEVILAQAVERHPANLADTVEISPTHDAVAVSFPLMNPGDFVRFCVYYAGELSESPSVSGRISGVTELQHPAPREHEAAVRQSRVRWWEILFWVVAGVFSAFGVPTVLHELTQRRGLRAALTDPAFFDDLVTGEDFTAFVKTRLGFLLSRTRSKLLEEIASSDLAQQNQRADFLESLTKQRTACGGSWSSSCRVWYC